MVTDFDAPTFQCDVILKGGITSGVVYPPAITELARTHRLRRIAGSSAGAIGASAAAAAEVGRRSATGGFPLLVELAKDLATTDSQGRTRLFGLFQPQDETRAIFSTVWDARSTTGFARWRVVLMGLLKAGPRRRLWFVGALTLILMSLPFVASLIVGGPLWLPLILSALLALLFMSLGFVAAVVWSGMAVASTAQSALTGNFHGFVNGSTPTGSDHPALTDWMYDALQRLAGRGDASQAALNSIPVTHGEVATAGAQFIAISTNLSRGTSEQIPFRDKIWAFDPDEFSKIFPTDVVDHMVKYAARPIRDDVIEALGDRLHLLPPPEQLPIIVTARMSLSFPVLLSAVPLHGLTPLHVDGEWIVKFVRNWFSDGGITSNLPVHLFDRPLPTYPTYAINLATSSDISTDPCGNVSRPIKAGQGRLPATSEISSTVGLLSAVFDTMQNWSDNNLIHTAGFKERICTIRLGSSEGGMNLDMPPERILPLIERGRCAGLNLSSMRTGDLTNTEIEPSNAALHQWDRHRWTRFRIAGAGLGRLVGDVQPVLAAPTTDGTTNYVDLGLEVAQAQAPFPYASDWDADHNQDAIATWESALDLAGQPPDRFGPGPPGIRLSFGANFDTVSVTPTPPVQPTQTT